MTPQQRGDSERRKKQRQEELHAADAAIHAQIAHHESEARLYENLERENLATLNNPNPQFPNFSVMPWQELVFYAVHNQVPVPTVEEVAQAHPGATPQEQQQLREAILRERTARDLGHAVGRGERTNPYFF